MKICENCNQEHEGNFGSGRFCSSKCAKGFSTKAKRKEINAIVSKKRKESAHKNVQKTCLYCGKKFTVRWNMRTQKCCSVVCGSKMSGGWKKVHDKLSKNDWSDINKKSYANGHNYVAGGTTKWYDYNGFKVQGTYELRTCKILDSWKRHNIIKDWEYTKDKIQYIGNDNKTHTYLLDFKVIANEEFNYYIEVKGYETPNDTLKWKAVRNAGYKLEVWFEKDIIKLEKEYVV